MLILIEVVREALDLTSVGIEKSPSETGEVTSLAASPPVECEAAGGENRG
jgi:hypothetical protein